ncbi:MAG: cupin domain-containing protein [Betaproteobacteria bacterium]|jgi:mannose-6-phosphate isomerase-like protein (cupin superfamily)|nr:cupin domain-containing protein [Betaproteobacteria bacterium]MBK7656858.1 cupin domain-containing protein [Betaproteobacteria bacterium]MBP6647136.1 cupin domain-containing protein [Burkholderiaceae bacterium]
MKQARIQTLLSALPGAPRPDYPEGLPFAQAFAHGSMSLELYAPGSNADGRDRQTPHSQDELYLVVRGTSRFMLEGSATEVRAGDALFVPAHAEHRFEDFSSDFATWVVFYGPKGGEHPIQGDNA